MSSPPADCFALAPQASGGMPGPPNPRRKDVMTCAEEALLTMRGICKYFPGVRALENVDFTLHSGEVHALVGENGAGKSTLIKVLTGVHAKDGGKIAMEGRPISPSSPLEAMKCGISTVYQEVNLCPNLSVAENIFIGREPKKAGGIDWKTINRRAAELLTTLNLNIDVTKTLGSYSVAVQQMIAIARAVDVDAKVLILDEPTSSLDEEETQRLFAVVRKLKARAWGSSLSPTSWIRSMSSATGSRCCATVSWWAPMPWRSCPGWS